MSALPVTRALIEARQHAEFATSEAERRRWEARAACESEMLARGILKPDMHKLHVARAAERSWPRVQR